MGASLQGKSVIVTGGASGIGRSVAIRLAKSGCRLIIADVDERGCQETLRLIEPTGVDARVIRTDISSEAQVEAMVESAVSAYGRLDGACNAAAILMQGRPTAEMPLEQWNRVMSINLTGAFLTMKHQIRAMLRTGAGSIVAVASTAGVVGLPGSSDYCAGKAGVLGLVRAASTDYASQGIRINAVMPGATRTPMFEKAASSHNIQDYLMSIHPIGRFAEPEEIASAVCFLISDDASFITGSSMAVDGGLTSI